MQFYTLEMQAKGGIVLRTLVKDKIGITVHLQEEAQEHQVRQYIWAHKEKTSLAHLARLLSAGLTRSTQRTKHPEMHQLGGPHTGREDITTCGIHAGHFESRVQQRVFYKP